MTPDQHRSTNIDETQATMTSDEPDGDDDSTDHDYGFTAEEVRDRPHPSRMALSCIWEESSKLSDVIIDEITGEDVPDELYDAANRRLRSMGYVLEERLVIDRPSCDVCGCDLERTSEGAIVCWEGGCDVSRSVREAYRDEERRAWVTKGHGGRADA